MYQGGSSSEGGVSAPPAWGVVLFGSAGRTWRGKGGGAAPLAGLVPGPILVPQPNDPVGTRQEVRAPEALGNSVALLWVVDPQEAHCVWVAVGLGPFVAKLLVGVATVPLRDVGPSPVLRVAELPLVLEVGPREVPEGLFQDHAQAPRGHTEDGFRGVARADAPLNHYGHGVRVVIRAAFALPGRLAAPASLVGPDSRCHRGRPFGFGRRILGGVGRQLALLDELLDQSVQFGACGQELAQSHVLGPQMALRELQGEVRPGSQV